MDLLSAKAPFVGLALLAVLWAGCEAQSAPSGEPAASGAARITDEAYLTAPVWNDGQAEVAFYEVQRARNQYGQDADQRFTVGTYLVKHRFSPRAMTKATEETDGAGVPAFKYALFYEFESGSYQYKRNYVVNARQADLAPLKASFTSFDWCSNLYREMAFQPGGPVEWLMRSDDYGNETGRFEAEAHAYPASALPLVVRGLDFSESKEQAFAVVRPGGQHVPARARLAGRDTLQLPGGAAPAERIEVTYDEAVPSMIAETSDRQETYWRGTGAERALLQLEGASGRYQMRLEEQLRTPYWKENLWPQLARISERP